MWADGYDRSVRGFVPCPLPQVSRQGPSGEGALVLGSACRAFFVDGGEKICYHTTSGGGNVFLPEGRPVGRAFALRQTGKLNTLD